MKEDALNDFCRLRDRVAAGIMDEVELVFSTLVDQMTRATAGFCKVCHTVWSQSKELAKVAHLKSFINILGENVSFYEVCDERLIKELAAVINHSTRYGQLVDDIRAELVDLLKRLCARDGVVRFIIEYLCASPEPSIQGSVENHSASLSKSMDEDFCAGSIGSQLHADTAINRITLRFV